MLPNFRAIASVVAFLFALQICHAQNTATLDVVVRDPSGALVSKAQVQLLVNNKQQSILQTNQKGEARFNRLQVSQYQIHVEAPGFKTLETTVMLKQGSNRIELPLEIGVIKADVNVAEEGAVRNTNPNGGFFKCPHRRTNRTTAGRS